MARNDLAFDRASIEAWRDDINSGCLFHAAAARGIAAEQVTFSPRASSKPSQWLRIRIGRRTYMYRKAVMYYHKGFFRPRWRHVNRAAPAITASKYQASNRMRSVGVSVPEGRLFTSEQAAAARDYFLSLGREACVKPDSALMGRGIMPRIADVALFDKAFAAAAADYERILVEESVAGEVIRYMIVGPDVAAVRLDRPANVVGDGASTIAALVEIKNAGIMSANLPTWSPIISDDEADRILALQGLAMQSVPEPGHRVYLRGTSNIPTGAEGVGSPAGLHPSYADEVLKAVRAIPDLVLSAIDVMVTDYTKPAAASNYWVLDVNSSPGIANFHFPKEGPGTDVAGRIMDWLIGGGPR